MSPRPEEDDGSYSLTPETLSGIHGSRHPRHFIGGVSDVSAIASAVDWDSDEYTSMVPQSLRERSKQAREKAGFAVVDVAFAEEEPTSTIIERTAVEIDISQAEVCNLSAVAIRKNATDALTGAFDRITDQKPLNEWTGSIYGIDPTSFSSPLKDLRNSERGALSQNMEFYELRHDSTIGEFKTDSFRSQESARVVAFVEPAREYMPQLVYWADVPYEKRRLRRDVLDVSNDRLANVPITVGLHFGGNVFASILKSQRTASGCTFLFPDGQELDGDAQNRPEILNALQGLVLCRDEREVNHFFGTLLWELREQANSKGNKQIEAVVNLVFRSYEQRVGELEEYMATFLTPEYLSGQEVRTVNVKDRSDGGLEKKSISVVSSIRQEHMIGRNPSKMVIYLSPTIIYKPEIGTEEYRLTLFSGLDEEIYGDHASIVADYVYVFDRFNGGRLYSALDQPELVPASEEETAEFMKAMTRFSKNTTEHGTERGRVDWLGSALEGR
jgi:hypothetical protein